MENGMNKDEITSCEELIMNTFSYIEKTALEKNNKFYEKIFNFFYFAALHLLYFCTVSEFIFNSRTQDSD